MRLIENLLLCIIFILMLPVMPFLIILSKIHERIHKDDPWIY